MVYEGYTAGQVISVLGGPPNDIYKRNGYYLGSACRAHSCFEKGIFIIDGITMDAVFGVVHVNRDKDYGKTGNILSLFYKNDQFIESVKEQIINKAEEESDSHIKDVVEVKINLRGSDT